jgi:hypothetical protein
LPKIQTQPSFFLFPPPVLTLRRRTSAQPSWSQPVFGALLLKPEAIYASVPPSLKEWHRVVHCLPARESDQRPPLPPSAGEGVSACAGVTRRGASAPSTGACASARGRPWTWGDCSGQGSRVFSRSCPWLAHKSHGWSAPRPCLLSGRGASVFVTPSPSPCPAPLPRFPALCKIVLDSRFLYRVWYSNREQEGPNEVE